MSNLYAKTIDRYLVRSIVAPFFIGLFVLCFLFIMESIYSLIELIVVKGVGLLDVGRLFVYMLPSFVSITVPMAVAVGVMMAFGQLSADNELVVIKAAGVSFFRICVPVLLGGLFLSLFMVFFNEFVLSWGNYNFKQLYFEIVKKKADVVVQEKHFIDSFAGYVLYVDKVDHGSGVLSGVTIFKLTPDGFVDQTIVAEEGRIVSDDRKLVVYLQLERGRIYSSNPQDVDRFHVMTFASNFMVLDINQQLGGDVEKTPQEMGIRELGVAVSKLPVGRTKQRLSYLVEYYKKISIPFASLTFVLISLPLATVVKRSGRSVNVGLALALVLLYYVLLIVGVALGEKELLSPALGVFLPNIVLSLLGAALLVRSGMEGFPLRNAWGKYDK